MLSCGVRKFVVSELSKVIVNDPDVRISSPMLGADIPVTLKEIQEFRRSQLGESNPYLFASTQTEIEERLQLEERSMHIIARYQGRIIGSVRLSSGPFEFSALSPDLANISPEFENYVEISRLVVDDTARGLGVGKKICYAAMVELHNRGKKGFVSIARLDTAGTYIRFGLTSYDRAGFELPTRPGNNYQLMWASWNMQIRGVLKYYAPKKIGAVFHTKTRYKRLREYHQQEERLYG